jgi:hypothetical protein
MGNVKSAENQRIFQQLDVGSYFVLFFARCLASELTKLWNSQSLSLFVCVSV